ncbi:hypothetical protein DL89DRAFT_85794 [Linderina pennispora]|uniref:Uncharacterized protein n=1 Tax=Linderina pennispora TaxID=61395 RepID=A0A1Y1WIE7_9FUNG|nr:uncharacterized protein DL89DRAFT_85794 [Linderina pennispora]ORX72986.1 hypothetical protein DL89DRAFT_85794 [Linderina pennispora]
MLSTSIAGSPRHRQARGYCPWNRDPRLLCLHRSRCFYCGRFRDHFRYTLLVSVEGALGLGTLSWPLGHSIWRRRRCLVGCALQHNFRLSLRPCWRVGPCRRHCPQGRSVSDRRLAVPRRGTLVSIGTEWSAATGAVFTSRRAGVYRDTRPHQHLPVGWHIRVIEFADDIQVRNGAVPARH